MNKTKHTFIMPTYFSRMKSFAALSYHYIISHIRSNKSPYIRLLALLLMAWIGITFLNHNRTQGSELQQDIAKKIIRFHVLANSDSAEDQSLKMKVKDALVDKLSPKLSHTQSLEEAREIIQDSFPLIKNVVEAVIQENGYSYPVTIALEPLFFPVKIYGDFTFPAGTYEALRVQIGEAEGQNWWCVMFPPLCFVDETYSIVDENSQDQLKYLLTEDEYDSLRDDKVPVKIRFKLFDKIKKLIITKK